MTRTTTTTPGTCAGCHPGPERALLASFRPTGAERTGRPPVVAAPGVRRRSGLADLVVFGSIVTMDPSGATEEAVAVEDGWIVAVGSRAEVGSLVGPDTVLDR